MASSLFRKPLLSSGSASPPPPPSASTSNQHAAPRKNKVNKAAPKKSVQSKVAAAWKGKSRGGATARAVVAKGPAQGGKGEQSVKLVSSAVPPTPLHRVDPFTDPGLRR